MVKIACIILQTLLSANASASVEAIKFQGTAQSGGKTVYVEEHTLTYEKGRITTAETNYKDQEGELLARMTSDFRKNMAIPEHTMEHYRENNRNGIRISGDQLLLFNEEKGKPEQTVPLREKKTDDRILVAGQGLNYYLLSNLDSITRGKPLLIEMFVPSALDSYNFDIHDIGKKGSDLVELKIRPHNWLLNMVVPTIEVHYDKKSKRLLYYKGISNLKDENLDQQIVEIHYQYEEG